LTDNDACDALVSAYDRTFGGIDVEGLDLASVNRTSFYISILSEAPFLCGSILQRARETLLGHALFAREFFMRDRFQGTPRAAGPPKVLFFGEGVNPSVDGTIRSVLAQFPVEEARVAIAYEGGGRFQENLEVAVMDDYLSRGAPRSLASLPGILRVRQRRAVLPVLRRASLRAWLLRHSLRTAAAGRAFRRLFDAYPASVLVTASDTGFWGRCATLEAKRRGIPSLTLQHGMMAGAAGYVPVVSDRFGAWGKAGGRWLRERGVPAEKIVVVGAPRLQDPASTPRMDRAVLATKLAIDPARRWVLLATNPIPLAKNAAMIEVARAGVRAWDAGATLVLKLHPSEEPAAYRAIAGSDRGVLVVPHGEAPLYDLLGTVDAVLTFHSSVGLEGMLFDRPIVSLEPFGEENPLSYGREGAAAVARTAQELTRALREDIPPGAGAGARREARLRYLEDNLLAVGEKSAARVRALIRALASKGAP